MPAKLPPYFTPRWILFLFPLFLASEGEAAFSIPIAVHENTSYENLSDRMEMLLDQTGTLTLDQVRAPETAAQFVPVQEPRVHRGITNTPLWLRMKLVSPDHGLNGVLTFQNPRLESVQCFLVAENGSVGEMQIGTDFPFYSRSLLHPAPSFLLNLPMGQPREIYVRVSHEGSLRFQVAYRSALSFHRYVTEWTAYTFLLIGAFTAIGLYNLFIFLSLRERSYLYCSLLIFSFLIFQMSLDGTANMYLWPNSPWWASRAATTMVLVSMAMATLFADTVLDGRRVAPALSVLVRVMGGLCLLTVLLGLTDSLYKYFLSHALGMLVPILMFVLAIQSWRRGYRPARYFVLAWSVALMGSGMLALLGPGFVQTNFLTENLAVIGILIAVFIWSFALTDRIKVRDEAQRRVLQDEVAVRTEELGTALADVKALRNLLPICSSCKKIRDDGGYWNEVEHYLHVHKDLAFSHSMCPQCMQTLYPQYYRAPASEEPA